MEWRKPPFIPGHFARGQLPASARSPRDGAALRQNAPNGAWPKFPSSRYAGNEIDRKVLRCSFYFDFCRFA
jgi:hypothetical protein